MEHGLRLWDTIAAAGEEFGIVPVGIGVYAVTGRIEKGYRLMGAELESEYDPVEAGLARPKVKSADFIGKDAYLAARARRRGQRPDSHAVHVDDDRPHVGGRHPALPDRWQRADPDRRRRAHRRRQGPDLAGDDGRCGTFAGRLPVDGLPAAAARGGGRRAARHVHERAVPGRRVAGSAARRCSTPTTPA